MRLRLLVALSVGACLLASCGEDQCDWSTCAGCCNSRGVCEQGTTFSACGASGSACATCSGAQQCVSGVCGFGGGGGGGGGGGSAGCSSATCAGCCLNGSCQSGNTAAACGKNAAQCAACANNQICRLDQTCGVDPNSMWRVQPTNATIAGSNNGSAWDGDGSAPDVSVAMICPPSTTVSSQTPEVESYSPTWSTGGCTAKASDLLAQPWTFRVWDIDLTSDDPITGNMTFQFTEASFAAGSVTFAASGGMQSLRVALQKQ